MSFLNLKRKIKKTRIYALEKLDKAKYLALLNSIFYVVIENTLLRTIQTKVGTRIR